MTPALKEWSAAVHALLDGRQTVLLRKGGIGEKRSDAADPAGAAVAVDKSAGPAEATIGAGAAGPARPRTTRRCRRHHR